MLKTYFDKSGIRISICDTKKQNPPSKKIYTFRKIFTLLSFSLSSLYQMVAGSVPKKISFLGHFYFSTSSCKNFIDNSYLIFSKALILDIQIFSYKLDCFNNCSCLSIASIFPLLSNTTLSTSRTLLRLCVMMMIVLS